MNQDNMNNSRVLLRIGFWSVLILGALFVLYVFCFVGISKSGPLFIWTNMQDFLAYVQSNDQTLKYISYAGMLVFCVAFAVLCQCILTHAPDSRKPAARIGAMFGSLFALAPGANYFVQLTCVRLSLLNGATAGLEQVVMANPVSAMESVNMLGWTVLLGLSCLFMAFAIEGRGAARAARISLFTCAANSLVAAVGFVLDSQPVLAICMYPLLGGSVIAISASLCVLFGRAIKKA